jgi:MinD superfamily P-loop ATPase
MQISVLSGKGGTGKTTIAVNLAVLLKDSCYIDCDVEEPNGHIFLNPEYSKSERVEVMVPAIDKEKCSGCGECVRFCYFNALALANKKVLLFPEICHSCGGCIHVCPENAVTEGKKDIGRIDKGWGEGIECVRGVLEIGEPVGVPIIKEIKSGLDETKVNILDCPQGSSCTVVNSIQGCDYALLVTEPTNFGVHDLKIAVQLIEKLGIPGGVVINRSGEGDVIIDEYCSEAGIPVLGRIPFDRGIAEAYSRGSLLAEDARYRKYFDDIAHRLEEVLSRETACHNKR